MYEKVFKKLSAEITFIFFLSHVTSCMTFTFPAKFFVIHFNIIETSFTPSVICSVDG